ncbi:hypothetical protein SNE40_020488 [Patella caerulea]|uniref:Beta-1,3-galactosyl-O-glycosyl-glycoprotein beta-1,6-N-acetylglucosaminyltransferase n=1 Tax=Patella caerulea TaxID=87958 RepID=A0AAN8GE45_PATCE
MEIDTLRKRSEPVEYTLSKERLAESQRQMNSGVTNSQGVGNTGYSCGRRQVHEVSCFKIIEGDPNEIHRAKTKMKETDYTLPSDESITNATQDCVKFRNKYGYDSFVNTEEEKSFPIAFNILLYKDVAQVGILLRAIYRPQNYYCLHVDGFSPDHVHKAAKSLANCFDNVFIVSKTEKVVYKSFQRLQADINCMSDHLDFSENWKYLINLPSQEFPLKTNLEIVKILTIYNNSNDVEGILGNRMMTNRFKYKHKYKNTTSGSYVIEKTNEKNPNPPHNIRVVKGSAYGIFTRQFVNYVVNNEIAKDFLQWCHGVLSPDEYYWSTLNHNPHLKVPGSYKGQADKKKWLAAYASWAGADKCAGRWMRGVCVFGVGDLNSLVSRNELFANKFEMNFQPLGLRCLSEWLYNKTVSPLPFNDYYYKQLPFIKKHF